MDAIVISVIVFKNTQLEKTMRKSRLCQVNRDLSFLNKRHKRFRDSEPGTAT